jgi:uncharacterized protein (DUF2252 family)
MRTETVGRPLLPDPEYLPRIAVAERVARGRSLRAEFPPERVAAWNPGPWRNDPVAVLQHQARSRIPELVPIRHGRMMLSPFAFFRGGAAIMAADIAAAPSPGLRAQLCGDAHLLNFGLFETPERSLVFGINDFDETLPGPVEWDVKRLLASVEVAGRDLGFTRGQRRSATMATVGAYRRAMLGFAKMRTIDVWYARLPARELRRRLRSQSDKDSSREVKRRLRQALQRDHLHAFSRLIEITDGEPRFHLRPPVLVPIGSLLDGEQRERYVEVVRDFLEKYRASLTPDRRSMLECYRYHDMARKVVGVGSVGTRAWVVLFMGRDAGDPLLLQLKEAQRSVLEPFAGACEYESQGRRVVEGQRLIQAASDPMLGWYELRAWDGQMHDFYVRQLWDGKASIGLPGLTPPGLAAYGDSCGWTLARAHARSGDRIALAAYLGEDDAFDRAFTEFAAAYAETNEADCRLVAEAVADGRLDARTG